MQKNELTKQEKDIADFLDKYHTKGKPINMEELGNIFDISPRIVRDVIERIVLSQTLVIASSNNGYWVAKTQEEIKEANRLTKARLEKTIKRLAANKGDLNWLYNHIKNVKENYPNYHEKQIQLNLNYSEADL